MPKVICVANRSEDTRYPSEIRWTGVLQKKLGSRYEVLEEGLNSRTTQLDYPDLKGRNGLTALPKVLERNPDISLFILALGTNDLKLVFDQTPEQIAEGIESLVNVASRRLCCPILILAPPIPLLELAYDSFKYPELEKKAKSLARLYSTVAQNKHAHFIDLSRTICSSSIDGVHLDPDQHATIAALLESKILEIL